MNLTKAISVAFSAHEGQKRHNGSPYIVHPMRVMSLVYETRDRITKDDLEYALQAAVLHDVVEDTSVSFTDLEEMGFHPRVIELITLLTKVKGVSYDDYMAKIMKDRTAMVIKLCDMDDNKSSTDVPAHKEAWLIRKRKKYNFYSEKIMEILY